MDPLSTSLLIPLMIEFFQERRNRKANQDFGDFQIWLKEKLPEILHSSEGTFLVLRESSEAQNKKLDQIIATLNELASHLGLVDLSTVWGELEEAERLLLGRMFRGLVEKGNSHIDAEEYQSEARLLKERGLAIIHQSSASFNVSLSNLGALFVWACKEPHKLDQFENNLPEILPKQPCSKRLGAICESAAVSEHLADAYMCVLRDLGRIKYENDTWPPGMALIYGVSEHLLRNGPDIRSILAKEISAD